MAVSPMMQQYFSIKDEYPDCILFFRLGDFYEMFYEDAKTVSRELELVLTGKDCGQETRAPMCGIPYHAAESYLSKLISKGYKVAICEQLEDPATCKGLVKRDVIRVVTPGTVTQGTFLSDDRNNYICSLCRRGNTYGAAFADISTGELCAMQIDDADTDGRLYTAVCAYEPSELLFDETANREILSYAKNKFGTLCTPSDDGDYDYAGAQKEISALNVTDDGGMGEASVCAAGALIKYLRRTQKGAAEFISSVRFYSDRKYLETDAFTVRSLELTESASSREKRGSLLGALDKTCTSPGARLLRKWILSPLVDVAEINSRLDATEELLKNPVKRGEIANLLKSFIDIERMTAKIIADSANAYDLKALEKTLRIIPEIKKQLENSETESLKNLNDRLKPLTDIAESIGDTIAENPPLTLHDGWIIKDGANEIVDTLRGSVNLMKDGIEQLEEHEKEVTGIKNLKIGYNKVFGYYIEVTKSFVHMVPQDRYIRRQTLANCERYVTPELKDYEKHAINSKDKMCALEYEIFRKLRENLVNNADRLRAVARVISVLDVFVCFANVAEEYAMVRPEVDNTTDLVIKDGRHIVVEKYLKNSYFVPNDCITESENDRLMLITGPNMAGKSTYMRQIALIVIMAQIGCFVPASHARVGVADKVFARVGASDDLAGGTSTFMLEMNEVAVILKNATKRSLIIYDEIGRGTSTFDGMSIAKAVAEYTAKNIGARTLFATHYHELTSLEGECPGVINYNIAAKKKNGELVFLRKIVRGGADESYGIEVASLAGVPEPVVKRAREVLTEIEAGKSGFTGENIKKRFNSEDEISALSKAQREVLSRVENLSADTMSPIEALTALYELQRLLRDGEKEENN